MVNPLMGPRGTPAGSTAGRFAAVCGNIGRWRSPTGIGRFCGTGTSSTSAPSTAIVKVEIELDCNQRQPIHERHRRQIGCRPKIVGHLIQSGNRHAALLAELRQQVPRGSKIFQASRFD